MKPQLIKEVHVACNASIYEMYSPWRRNLIVAAATVGIFIAFCSSIYLPALQDIQKDLHTRRELVETSVSVYLLTGGLGALVWGPASDRFGRAPVYAVACVSFLAACLGCMLAPTIELLLVFRALQGFVVAAFVSTAFGVLADIVPPEIRGKISGMCMAPIAVGPIVAPLMGGALSQAFGWRSTFIPMIALCCVCGLGLALLMRRDTHQYFVLQRLAKQDPAAAALIQEYAEVMANPPKFVAPWVALRYIVEAEMLPHALVGISSYAFLQSLIIQLPTVLAHPPYGLCAGLIGVALLSPGIAGLIAGPLGGILSDRFGAAQQGLPVARLIPNTFTLTVLGCAGLLASGWALYVRAHLALMLAPVCAACFGYTMYVPGLFSYITTIKQSAASAASGGVQSMMTLACGLMVLAGSFVIKHVGYGWWFTGLACIQFCVAAVACEIIMQQRRAATCASANMPPESAAVIVDCSDAAQTV